MSRTYRGAERRRLSFMLHAEEFRCRRCKLMVFPVPSGGHHRNHCPYCLWSRHVDRRVPGDRASDCGSLMRPVGVIVRPSGEQAVLHRCLGCGLERRCRVAADDDTVAVMRLPVVALPAPASGVPAREAV
ncbi:MAG TPA: RNHCP domain-containing protein [Chloroflexota bacterium]|nr:RNHCP domain-containing protein [Chloroflexota bacterium]